MDKMTVKDVNLKGKKVIVRVDFNVPLEGKNITDDRRIQEAVPTIKYILSQKPKKVILMSHFGRPDGEVKEDMRLTPVAKRLEKLLGEKVLKLDDCIGEEVKKSVENSKENVIMLENVRFHKEETKNDPQFAKQLASLADIYVNDAFGTAHRAHASTEGITHYLPSVAGFLLEKELKYLGLAVNKPKRPFVVILGGAKVSDKILLIENLIDKSNAILIGGGMAYTFLKAQGKKIGKSICEHEKVGLASDLLAKAKKKNVNIVLASDFLIVEDFKKTQGRKYVTEIPDGWEGVDVGPQTIKAFKEILASAQTIVWNGPLGVFEIEEFSKGTRDIAEYLATLKKATTIIGGGDSAAAVAKFGLDKEMTHISTGGGASLELLEGKVLPGVAALKNKTEVTV